MILHHADCLQKLKELAPDSIDSLVTDPPAGISFMGKEWDDDKGGRKQWIAWMTEVMREVHRVLKPGAHGLVWALPRTSHWTATALEDAGFEIRDVVTHLFGQGFPKSLDISKAIDKAAGQYVPGEVLPSSRRAGPRTTGIADTFTLKTAANPQTDAAKQWAGWGTALKPASEHWILVRKPCSEKTVAANVLKWGTGGINIDGSRIWTTEMITNHSRSSDAAKSKGKYGDSKEQKSHQTPGQTQGRFPANLVLSHTPFCTDEQCDLECAIKMLDEQSLAGGMHSAGKASSGKTIVGRDFSVCDGPKRPRLNTVRLGDCGGASRFFYCAKISSSERGEGNNHPTVKAKKLMGYLIKLVTPPGGVVLDPFMGSGSTGIACREQGFEFVGIERDPQYFEIAKQRIKA